MNTENLFNKEKLKIGSIDEGELDQILRHPRGCECDLCKRWRHIAAQVCSVLR